MANKDDYLTEYRQFFEHFAQTVNPHDQLPVKLASYKLVNVEVVGAIIDWTTQYLTQKQCPQTLLAPLIKIVIDETRKSCKKQPISCGFDPSYNAYEPLKLMQTVMAKTNDICLRYLDNSTLCSLPAPGPPYNRISVFAIKNSRRRMEDRHVVIHDLNTMFNIQEASPSSYYAIFDGHAGYDAAAYSCAHLHQYLAENKHFVHNPEKALLDAFCKTDALFIDKCKVEKIGSGTTAVCALLRPKEKTLYIAWVGDSQALLVNQGKVLQCVHPHKPCREDERLRIEQEGGVVIFWGTWRVNGQLAVSRAIGDCEYKPAVIAIPDVQEIPLNGDEDFLILACDGLWDFLTEDDAACMVYNMIRANPDDTEQISQRLVQTAKHQGSSDNISVIVVFLREPSKIAADAHWANRNRVTMDAGLDNANATNNPFANSNGTEILPQKDGFLLNLTEGFKQNGSEISPPNDYMYDRSANGKRSADEFDEDEDMGPETDIDAVDDISPSAEHATKTMLENKHGETFDPFATDLEEKVAMEIDLSIQKQQSSEFDPARSPREETPTPPADEVHDVVLEENVADSGEESEDEWNYYKGDTAEKEAISKADLEVAELTKTEEDSDNMSKLNPEADEFVPIQSPTRNTSSPACRALINETVLAQSPRKATPTEMDINLPSPKDFEKEVKSRPSEVFSNGHKNNDGHKLSSQEVMENLLNEEFHFGPNATPFSTPGKTLDQSEAAYSNKAEFGDESSASYLEGKTLLAFENSFTDTNPFESGDVPDFQSKPKEQDDPMSMSFYQDKDEPNDLFDLNKVHDLPENLEDYLNKDNGSFNETISDLPEHDPSSQIENAVATTDLDRVTEFDDATGGDLISGVTELPKTPEVQDVCHTPVMDQEENFCQSTPLKSVTPDVQNLDEAANTPLPLSPEPVEECQIPVQPSAPTESAVFCDLSSASVDAIVPDVKDSEEFVSQANNLNLLQSEDICNFQSSGRSDKSNYLSETPEHVDDKQVLESCLHPTDSPVDVAKELVNDIYDEIKSKETVDEPCQYPLNPLAALSPSPRSPMTTTPEPTEERCDSPLKIVADPSELLYPNPLKSPALSTPEPTEELLPASKSCEPEPPTEELLPASKSCEPEPPTEDLVQVCPQPATIQITEQTEDLCQISTSADLTSEPSAQLLDMGSKLPDALTPEHNDDLYRMTSASPSASGGILTPEPSDDLCLITSESPSASDVEPVEVCDVPAKSPVLLTHESNDDFGFTPAKLSEVTHELHQPTSTSSDDTGRQSVEQEELFKPNCSEEVVETCEISNSPEPVKELPEFEGKPELESPLEGVTSSIKDDVSIDTPNEIDIKDVDDAFVQDQPQLETTNLNYAQELSSAMQECLTNEVPSTINDTITPPVKDTVSLPLDDTVTQSKEVLEEPLNSTPKSTVSEQIDTESVATVDVNSFLERSEISDVTSPLSPNEPPLQEQFIIDHLAHHPLSRCVYPLSMMGKRTEDAVPPTETPASPVESKEAPVTLTEVTPEATVTLTEVAREATVTLTEVVPEATITLTEVAPEAPVLPEIVPETEKEALAVVAAATTGAVAGVAAIAISSEKEKKPPTKSTKTTPITKKPATKTATSPTKSAVTKAPATTKPPASRLSASSPTKPVTATRVSRTSASPRPATAPSTTKTSTLSKPSTKPKLPATATKLTEKKPITNGDAKPAPARTAPITKRSVPTTTSSISRTSGTTRSSATGKLSPAKTPTETKPAPITRPTSAPAKPTTARLTTTAPKPRPTTLATKTTTTSSIASKTSASVPSTRSTNVTKTTTASSPKSTTAKPRLAPSSPRPKPLPSRLTAKGPDTDKQMKESTNKQLSARTTSTTTRTTASTMGKTTSTTVRKMEAKTPGTRTISTKTTITTLKSSRKPTEITRNVTSSKATKTPATKPAKPLENGLSNGITTIVQETTTIISSEPQLVKDISPVESNLIDNSQLPETNVAD